MAIQPAGRLAGASAGATGSVPAFRKLIAGEEASGLVCTAVVTVSGAAMSPATALRTSPTEKRTPVVTAEANLVFINGRRGGGTMGGFEGGARRAGIVEERLDLF